MPEFPSRTSILVAAARAVGARIGDANWRNPDHLAEKLIGEAERQLIQGDPVADAFEHDSFALRANPRVMGIVMTMIVRTKFVDERLLAAVASGATQIVILGAGWDTRAYRFAEQLRGVRVFEVDRPELQEWKRQRAERELGPAPSSLTHLPCDFRTQRLADALAASAYDPARKTFFIWEGVTMYLPEEAVRETLSWIAKQAPGSSIVFDFADVRVIDLMRNAEQGDVPDTPEAQIGAARARQLSRWQEPWIFGLPTADAAAFVEALGFEHRETMAMASADAARRYLGWDQAREFPFPIRHMYSIMEAAVRS